MKSIKNLIGAALLSGVLSISIAAWAAEHNHSGHQAHTQGKVTPYPLKTCLVTDEKFGGDMGEPYVFTNGIREIKLCCKGCLKDFNKDSAKYIKKLEPVEKHAK